MNENPQSDTPSTPQPQPSAQQPAPMSRSVAGGMPLMTPEHAQKQRRLGWIFIAASSAIFIIALFFGYVLGLTAILSAYAGSLGIRFKSKALAIVGIAQAVLFVALYIIAVVTQ